MNTIVSVLIMEHVHTYLDGEGDTKLLENEDSGQPDLKPLDYFLSEYLK